MQINLKAFRDAYGYTQQDLAKALGKSQSAVSRTEGVGAELTGPQIEKLCAKFGKDKVLKFVGYTSRTMDCYLDLKEFRRDHNLRQEDLAKILGIGQTDMSRVERNYKRIKERQYQVLIDKYGEEEIIKYAGASPREMVEQRRMDASEKEEIYLLTIRSLSFTNDYLNKEVLRLREEIAKLRQQIK